jgi:hypothetical protein
MKKVGKDLYGISLELGHYSKAVALLNNVKGILPEFITYNQLTSINATEFNQRISRCADTLVELPISVEKKINLICDNRNAIQNSINEYQLHVEKYKLDINGFNELGIFETTIEKVHEKHTTYATSESDIEMCTIAEELERLIGRANELLQKKGKAYLWQFGKFNNQYFVPDSDFTINKMSFCV